MVIDISKTLVIIPARGGSKGILQKNIKLLNQKPLIVYTIEAALEIFSSNQICVSTDDKDIAACATEFKASVPFIRPAKLATDISGSYDVLLHAIEFYKNLGQNFETLVLLQPTSPFRNSKHIQAAINLYNPAIDMVVSVCNSKYNPYYNLFEENEAGFLAQSKPSNIVRRQDAPNTYFYNGAIYVINVKTLLQKPLHQFKHIIKYEMDEISSTDIDTPLDWAWAEFLIQKNYITNQ
jgi:CMP-N,N'-diacetyllegionaminic acid synthase